MTLALSPEELRDAPRVWKENGSGVGYKVVDIEWILRRRKAHDEATGKAKISSLIEDLEKQRKADERRDKSMRQVIATPAANVSQPKKPIHSLAAEARANIIITKMAAIYGVGVLEIKGPRRGRKLALIRHHIMYEVARSCPHMSLPQLGRIFNRDHTSLIHALREWPRKAAAEGIPCKALKEPARVPQFSPLSQKDQA